MRLPILFVTAALLAFPALAQEISIAPSDSTQSVLGAVQGREFFDAVVPLESVEAVLIRTKQ